MIVYLPNRKFTWLIDKDLDHWCNKVLQFNSVFIIHLYICIYTYLHQQSCGYVSSLLCWLWFCVENRNISWRLVLWSIPSKGDRLCLPLRQHLPPWPVTQGEWGVRNTNRLISSPIQNLRTTKQQQMSRLSSVIVTTGNWLLSSYFCCSMFTEIYYTHWLLLWCKHSPMEKLKILLLL